MFSKFSQTFCKRKRVECFICDFLKRGDGGVSMKKIVFGLLAITCIGCNSNKFNNMHFGPGPDDKFEESIEEHTSCAEAHN
jgi:hypothetical protein